MSPKRSKRETPAQRSAREGLERVERQATTAIDELLGGLLSGSHPEREPGTLGGPVVPSPEPAPVAPPVDAAAAAPAIAAAVTAPSTAAPTGRARGGQVREAYTPLDATHTQAEQNVYSVMYRLTVSRGIAERRFTVVELARETGIKSDRTIRTALHGLAEKLSLAVLDKNRSSNFGPLYHVRAPKEVFEARRHAGIRIDEQTKRIAPVSAPVAAAVDAPAATGAGAGADAAAEFTGGVTGRSLSLHENHDDDLMSALRGLLPGESDEAIARARAEIHTILAAFVERAAERAVDPPARAAFFVKCVRTALAAREAIEKVRGPRRLPQSEPAPRERPEAEVRALIHAVIREIRNATAGDPSFTDEDLRAQLEQWAVEQKIENAGALIEESLKGAGFRPIEQNTDGT